MARVLVSPPALSACNPLVPPNISVFRKHTQERRRCQFSCTRLAISSSSLEPISGSSLSIQTHLKRRDLLLFGLCSSAFLICPSPGNPTSTHFPFSCLLGFVETDDHIMGFDFLAIA
ncbi:hypothetical protein CKAN_00148700 [Cinnamomum micranthum f. kanehirae]|uniref:Uncharacterized protein n=1 Tax=Cinnamomum micranthum f. kanehirae TaxID=337451 RepID=A0A3S3MB71_9MAGN|nr:hypothetical protein CKAN_00148700 [Cinnamomum micranthum f. kanehirae]